VNEDNMNYKILIVDDEQNNRDIICEFLNNQGYQIYTTSEGAEALELISSERFDLYILDVYMPQMNGLELMKKIKLIDPAAVFVITTGNASIDVAMQAIRGGAFHYLTKPIVAQELYKVVETSLRYHDEMLKSLQKSPGDSHEDTENFIDTQLLRGFNPAEKTEFHEIAETHGYEPGFDIPMLDDPGSIIVVESGVISIWVGDSEVEKLHSGESWGEETFVSPSYLFTMLKAETDTRIKHYSRKKIIEYFTYKDESLTKRFTINLMTVLYLKWKKAILKIGTFTGYENNRI
jgi:CheY-like chemotaxis protein